MNYFDWTTLAGYTGALAMVTIITEITKNIKIVKKIPTQLWSYLISLFIMYPAYYFTNQLNLSNAFLILFNAGVVSLSSNGSFEFLKKYIMPKKNDE